MNLLVLAGLLAGGPLVAQVGRVSRQDLQDPKAQESYVLGVDLARNLKRRQAEVDLDLVIRGLRDGYSGEKLPLRENEIRQALLDIQTDIMRKQKAMGRLPAEVRRKQAEAFLAANQAKPDIVTLPSGLQYKVLKPGTGRRPAGPDTVECYCRGTLMDGTEFLSTEDGRPMTFKVKEAAVRAWAEALELMPAGSKWRLYTPSGLAYGDKGVGREVGPNQLVIFDLELLAIK